MQCPLCARKRSSDGIVRGSERSGGGNRASGAAGRGSRRKLRDLVREMSQANPLWGAPRIHGELLKLGIEVSQSTVANYMRRCSRPPSQSWKTFLRNHAPAIDVLVVPTVGFNLLYCL